MKKHLISIKTLLVVSLVWFPGTVKAFELSNNFGAGFGIPYGLFGVNYELEMNLSDSFAIGPSIGLGTTLVAGAATQYGVRIHLLNKDSLFRIGASYWNAVNSLAEEIDINGKSSFKAFRGNVVGLEGRFQFGKTRKHGLDIHIMKILTPTKSDFEKDGYDTNTSGSSIKIGVGYVLRFH